MSTEAPLASPTESDPALEAAGQPSLRRARWIAMLALVAAGIAIAAELTHLHVRIHFDPGYRSFCAINATFNCDTVAQSPYSVFLGIPISVWGLLGFLAMGAVAIPGAFGRRAMPGAMLALTAIGTLWCGTLAVISVTKISSVCILCLATYAINLLLLALAVIEARRAGGFASVAEDARYFLARPQVTAALAVTGMAVLGGLMAFYPAYWRQAQAAVPSGAGGLATGVEDGHPWIGAREPKLTIYEFSDYQCPHCQRGHEEMRAFVAQHPEQVRLVHRNFPLDQACNSMVTRPFHVRACDYASMAVCAGEQGRFWEANDYLFASGRAAGGVDAGAFAAAVKVDAAKLAACVKEKAGSVVAADVAEGLRLGIQGTPSYVVEGKLYPGRVPDEVKARAQ